VQDGSYGLEIRNLYFLDFLDHLLGDDHFPGEVC